MDFFRKNLVRIALGLVIIIAILWWMSTQVDMQKLGEAFLHAHYLYALLTIPVVLLSHFLRAWRWRTLLQPVAPEVKLWDLFSAVMVGYAANNIIPRSGEILRPYVFSKRSGVAFATVGGSVVVERFIDVLNLLVFLGIAFVFIGTELQAALANGHGSATVENTLRSIGIAALFFFAFIIVIALTSVGEKLLQLLLKPLPESLRQKVTDFFNSFKQGLRIVTSPSEYLRLGVESCLIWIMYILPMYIMFYAFDFHTTHSFSFLDACVILLVMAIGTTLAPTPGAIGVIHAMVPAAMTQLYGVSKEEALAYATLAHAMNYLSVTIVGGLFMMRENVKPTGGVALTAEASKA